MFKEAAVLLLTALLGSCTATTEHLLQESPNPILQEPQGFAVQTGYEGFLVPAEQSNHFLHSLPIAAGIAAPVLGFKAIAKAGLWFFGLVMIVLTGAGLASAVCAFTPLCTLGLAFGRQNSDKLQILTTFVHNALDRYSRLQKN